MSAGYEHLDLGACRRHGVRLGYTPDILTDATAELGVALLLAVSRRLIEGEDFLLIIFYKKFHAVF